MPAMMGNQPMKNDYVSGLEDAIAKKTRPPMGPRRPPMTLLPGKPSGKDGMSKREIRKKIRQMRGGMAQ